MIIGIHDFMDTDDGISILLSDNLQWYVDVMRSHNTLYYWPSQNDFPIRQIQTASDGEGHATPVPQWNDD